MKKPYLFFLACLTFLMVGLTPHAQAQLTAGDLAIVFWRGANGVPATPANCATDDSVTIITLVNLSAGQQFILTDQSMHDNGGANPEQFSIANGVVGQRGKAFIYTTPAGGVSAYSLITFNGCALGSDWTDYKTAHAASPYVEAYVPPASPFWIDDVSGDQLFLFIDSNTGNATEPMAEPLFIFGMDFTSDGPLCLGGTPSSGWDNNVPANPTDPYISIEPAGLITAGASLELGGGGTGCGSAMGVYSGPMTFTSQADALTKITNPANWTEGDALNFPNFGPPFITSSPTIYQEASVIHAPTNPFNGPATGPSALCQNLTVPLNTSGNASIVPSNLEGGSTGGTTPYTYAASQTSFTCSDIGPNNVTLTVTDATTASSTCTADVTITDITAPTAQCQAITVPLNAAGSIGVAKNAMDNGSSDNCTSLTSSNFSINPSTVTCANVGTLTATTTVTDASGNSSICTATMTVEDNIPPTALCSNVTASLNGSGTVTISPSTLGQGSLDNCGVTGISATQTTFTCSDIANSPVSVTVQVADASGNTTNCTSSVTVVDPIAPTATCQNHTISLDGSGNASISGSDLDGGSSDNCGIATFSASQTAFNCSDVGPVSVSLNVIDGSGNVAGCNATVTVNDNNPPSASCQNHTLNLPGTTGSITAFQVDNGSSSLCGTVSLSVSPSTFSCTNLGVNTVTLTVDDDANGQSSTCTAEVTVADPAGYCCAAPVAACNPVTVELDGSGMGTLAASDAGAGSTADCGLATLIVSPSQFDCNDVGDQPYTLTVTDVNGASSTCGGTVSVQDNIAPTITILGDNPFEFCEFDTYTDPGATWSDNCAGTGAVVDVTSTVDENQDGTYTVTYNYTDPSGNAATAAVRTVIVNPTPGAFAQQGCGNCGQIRSTICQYDAAPDLQAYVLSNPDYEAGATLNWYEDDDNSKGDPLPGAPTVDPTKSGTQWYWVEQQLGDCPGPCIRVRVRVKKQFAPVFNLPAIGCGGAPQLNLVNFVSDPKNKTTLYTFFDVDPDANPGATPIGSATATNGVVNFGQNVVVNVLFGSQTYWVQNTVPNGCGSTASSTLVANTVSPTLNFVSDITVPSGASVNITFSGTNATHFLWLDHVSFGNPNIGIVGSMGLNALSFTAYNPTTSSLTAKIRAIPYNGNCAGQLQDFFITVLPGAPNRQANQLQLLASMVNAHDVQLDWVINSDQELIRFEVEKKRNDGEFEAIGYQDWAGNGSYQYTDESSMRNANEYRLKLIYADGRIVWSDVVKVNMDFIDNHRFELFPNPTAGQFQVKALFPMQNSYTWQLSDVMGKTLMQGIMEAQQTTIQIESLAQGVYHLVMISPEGKRYLMKLVKQ